MVTRFREVSLVGAVLAAFLVSCQPAEAQDSSTFSPPPDQAVSSTQGTEGLSEKGYSVLGKGPVHEAYAQPYRKNPGPTPIVPRKPPAPIAEEPPNQKPEGDNVQWIPGYWAWDTDQKDFIWVSGLWRVPPPGRQWVPGYWAEGDGRQRWTPGYWADARQGESGALLAETDYLPEPPASLDYGPSVSAPDDNSIYEPGCWVYRSSRYVWRPGFWTTGNADWMWNPPCYSWTPAGCTYVSGYWDYPLADRGLLFAPVSFNQPLWENPGWSYRPNCVFGVGGLLSALFCRPDCCSYYYGNYFSPAYAGLGFQPWCGYGWHGYGYDPLFSHYGWANRSNPGWYNGLRADFLARRNGLLPTPAGTLARQATLTSQPGGGRLPRTVTPLQQLHSDHVQLTTLNQAQLAQQRAAAGRFRTLANQRLQAERPAAAGTRLSRQTFGTATPGRFGTPGGRGPFGNASAGRAGARGLENSFGGSPGNRTAIPSPGNVVRNRSAIGNGTRVDAQSSHPPAANLGDRPAVPGSVSRQSFYSREAAPFANASAQSSRSPSSRGSSHRPPSLSRSAPSFHSGSPSFHGGQAPSFHGAVSSHGGEHFSGGRHSGGGHGGGGHSGGARGSGEHHR